MPGTALAHPHEFVSMRAEIEFDGKNKASAFRYHWTFDEFFSAYAIEGQDANKNGVGEPEELAKLLVEILGNIHEIDYFTAFDSNGVVPKFNQAEPIGVKMNGQRLVIEFRVPFAEPLNVSKKPLRFAIYDNEFYIAMNFDPDHQGATLKGSAKECTAAIEAADPDEEIASFASSLGKTDSPNQDLGIHFAEWVTVKC